MEPGLIGPFTTKVSGYPIVFNLLLVVLAPIGFIVTMLALLMSLPIGVLPWRIAAASLVAILPPLLAQRASAALARHGVRGLLRAPIAIVLMLLGNTAIVGGLYQWRGLRPPHLIAAADHLHRVYLLGENPPQLEVVEPRPPLNEIYDRPLKQPSAEELAVLREETTGMDGIEIWSSDGDFRMRFLGPAARAEKLIFVDDHTLLAVRSTGRALILDAEKGEVLRTLEAQELLSEVAVETSTHTAIVSGKTAGGELAIHYFDLATGKRTTSLRSSSFVTFAVTSDLRRALIVDRGKKGELLLVAHDLRTGEVEANLPKAVLTDVKGRKLKSVTQIVAIGNGDQVLVFDGTTALIWNVPKKKAAPFPLAKAKIYPYAVVPGGTAYFHRRTDAGDPNPTGIYRLPSGDQLIELPTRGQPPRAFFTADGRTIAIGPAIFATSDGKIAGGRMPESFSLERDRVMLMARDGSAFVEVDGKERLAVKDGKLADLGVLPVRGENHGAIAVGGKLYAVRVKYPIDQWLAVLKDLDEWRPPNG